MKVLKFLFFSCLATASVYSIASEKMGEKEAGKEEETNPGTLEIELTEEDKELAMRLVEDLNVLTKHRINRNWFSINPAAVQAIVPLIERLLSIEDANRFTAIMNYKDPDEILAPSLAEILRIILSTGSMTETEILELRIDEILRRTVLPDKFGFGTNIVHFLLLPQNRARIDFAIAILNLLRNFSEKDPEHYESMFRNLVNGVDHRGNSLLMVLIETSPNSSTSFSDYTFDSFQKLVNFLLEIEMTNLLHQNLSGQNVFSVVRKSIEGFQKLLEEQRESLEKLEKKLEQANQLVEQSSETLRPVAIRKRDAFSKLIEERKKQIEKTKVFLQFLEGEFQTRILANSQISSVNAVTVAIGVTILSTLSPRNNP